MSKDDKLIEKIEQRPTRHDITYEELEKYYKLHGFFPEKYKGTSHVMFKNKEGIRVSVPKKNIVKPTYVKQAVENVHGE